MALAALVVLVWPGGPATGALVAGLVAAVLLVVDLALAPRPARVGVTRSLPTMVTLGAQATVSWTVSNPLGRPLVVRLADELAPSLGAGARRARLRAPARRSVTASASLAPTRRGRFTPAEMVVRVEGPMGLMGRQATRSLPGELRVYPSFGSRREAELRIERARILEVGVRSARSRGGGTEFEQLREYGVDDDSRRIDWAATARADRPIVRTYRAECNQKLLALLDNGRTMAGQVAGVARVEHAIDAVMMLTSVAARMGDMPGLGGLRPHGQGGRPSVERPGPVGAGHRVALRPGAAALPERLPWRVHRSPGPVPAPGHAVPADRIGRGTDRHPPAYVALDRQDPFTRRRRRP